MTVYQQMFKSGFILLLILSSISCSTCYGQYVQARNKINGTVLQINAQKKVKYRVAGDRRMHKGYIESISGEYMQIDGRQVPLKSIIEIRSWGVKKKNRLTGYLLTGGGALFTAFGVAALAEDGGEDGYGFLSKVAGATFAVGGSAATYGGLRTLKRKVFYLSQWEFLPTE